MVLDDRHIDYLEQVSRGEVFLHLSQFWGPNGLVHDQTVAVSMSIIGATHIVHDERNLMKVCLTPLGDRILEEEYEAWA